LLSVAAVAAVAVRQVQEQLAAMELQQLHLSQLRMVEPAVVRRQVVVRRKVHVRVTEVHQELMQGETTFGTALPVVEVQAVLDVVQLTLLELAELVAPAETVCCRVGLLVGAVACLAAAVPVQLSQFQHLACRQKAVRVEAETVLTTPLGLQPEQIIAAAAAAVAEAKSHREMVAMAVAVWRTCVITMRTLQSHSPKAPILLLP
jgi:hypothetical protein